VLVKPTDDVQVWCLVPMVLLLDVSILFRVASLSQQDPALDDDNNLVCGVQARCPHAMRALDRLR
jgi:hypothetical protein